MKQLLASEEQSLVSLNLLQLEELAASNQNDKSHIYF